MIKSCFAARTLFTNALMALPELFMNVSGSTSITFSLSIFPSAARALAFLLKTNSSKLPCRAKSWTVSRPALCRVFSYSFPGFPSPTITIAMAAYYHDASQKRSAPPAKNFGSLEDKRHLRGVPLDLHAVPARVKWRLMKFVERALREIVMFVLLAVLVVLPVRAFVAQPFIVDGESMHPTFENANYLIIDEISYRFKEPVRGDVIVFRYPGDPSAFYIKRIIGLPGETVSILRGEVSIARMNGETLTFPEPYVVSEDATYTLSTTLGEGEYFVLGDNRPKSSDSRIWGPLPREDIVGAYYGFVPLSVLAARKRGSSSRAPYPEGLALDTLDETAREVASFLKQVRNTGYAPSVQNPLFVWHTNAAAGRLAPREIVIQFHALGIERPIADAGLIRAIRALVR